MESVRLRLIFNDTHILSELQKSEGLNQSWLFLKPQHKTIYDVSCYIFNTFQLHHSCPHGLLLSMDGFILPPSESTCILKDNDIVSVKKKEGGLAIEGNHATNIAENNKTMEKQTVNTGPLLLANEEFEKESGGYKSEEPEDESEDEEGAAPVKGSSHPENLLGCNTKKRKAPEALPSSKKQKHCSEVAQKVDEQAKKSQQDLTSKKSFRKQKKVPDPDNKDVDNNKEGAESSKVNDSKSSMKNNKLQEYGVENVEATPMPEKVQKGPSRSSQRQYERRKVFKVIRKFVKEYSASESGGLANSGKRDDNLHPKRRFNGETGGRPKRPRNWKQQQDRSSNQEMSDQPKGLLHWKQEREEGKGGHANRQEQTKKSALCEKPGQDSSTEGEVVPAEIRPGHIRFEPPAKGQALQQDQVQAIEVSSLLEVSLVKNGTSDSVPGLAGWPSEGPAKNESNPVLTISEKNTDAPAQVNNRKETPSAQKENGNLWEQFSGTLSTNNGQLSEESGWGKWSIAKSSWSQRAQLSGESSRGRVSSGQSPWSQRVLEESSWGRGGSGRSSWSRGRGGPGRSSWSNGASRGRGRGRGHAPGRGRGRGPAMNF